MTKRQRRQKHHDAMFHFSKGKVMLTCSCGMVRRYGNISSARLGFAGHLASRKRNANEDE